MHGAAASHIYITTSLERVVLVLFHPLERETRKPNRSKTQEAQQTTWAGNNIRCYLEIKGYLQVQRIGSE